MVGMENNQDNHDTSSEDQAMADTDNELKQRIHQLEQHIKQQDDRMTVLETALARVCRLVESQPAQNQAHQTHSSSSTRPRTSKKGILRV